MRFVGALPHEQTLYATPFHRGCVTGEAPSDQCIDCFVLLCAHPIDAPATDAIARELAAANSDWVHVLGKGAERIHDAIDKMSVRLGRQRTVGDGHPMTSWHDDLISVDEMAGFVVLGGHGAAGALVAVIVGNETDFASAVDALERHRLRALHESDA